MKKIFLLLTAVASLTIADYSAKADSPATDAAEQVLFNVWWSDLSPIQRDTLKSDEIKFVERILNLPESEQLFELNKRIEYLRSLSHN